ncbi:hypothetical protein D3C71_1797040 [compost metagenome]
MALDFDFSIVGTDDAFGKCQTYSGSDMTGSMFINLKKVTKQLILTFIRNSFSIIHDFNLYKIIEFPDGKCNPSFVRGEFKSIAQ